MSVSSMNMARGLFDNVLARIADDVRRHRVLLLIALVLNVGDVVTTHFGLATGLPEGNGIPALLLANGGELAMLGGKIGVVAVALFAACLLGRRYPKLWHTFTVTNVVLLFAVLSNSAEILAR